MKRHIFTARTGRTLTLVIAALTLAALLAGCGAGAGANGGKDVSGRKIKALATVGMVEDVVRQVGGDRVEVEALMGPGVDPHLFKPSEGDVARINRADIVFYVGLHLEGKMGDILERSGKTRPVIAVAEKIPADRLLKPEAFEGAYDPHVWMDVSLWMETVKQVQSGLAQLDPGSAGAYAQRADAYLKELAQFDGWVKEQIATIPPESRVLVTAHDAFNYFGRAYGMDVVGLQGISTETEAGVGDVQQLASLIVERQVKAIFVESSVPRRNIEAVQAAARSRGHTVTIGGELFSDAMGEAGTPEGTYIGMIRHNVDTIVAGLR